mmetsp:Transcript_10614/g.27296  ORF Transcript_10614/g.27296 Transcript_10614/m.27296 type:complete len:592 (-) Transcript_10614:143-1918(-)
MTVTTSLLRLAVAATAVRGAAMAEVRLAALEAAVQQVVEQSARYYNTSYVAAVYGEDGGRPFMATHAAGMADRAGRVPITVGSAVPVGSVTKPFTAMRVMQLARRGRLGPAGIDTPIHQMVDPWLAKQTPPAPPMLALWRNDPTVTSITIRQVMGMSAGLQDYSDPFLEAWTKAHPTEDYLPMDFLSSLNKTWLYRPGQGSAYSSTGYVLLGMVIAQAEGDGTWQDVDQTRVFREGALVPLALNDTFFAKGGPCSQYPAVVHQYAMAAAFEEAVPRALRQSGGMGVAAASAAASAAAAAVAALSTGIAAATPLPQCSSTNWTKNVRVAGYLIPSDATFATAAECCSYANTYPLSLYVSQWTHMTNGTCILLYMASGPPVPAANAVTGTVVTPPLTEDMFFDLYDDSCLNGWTMGNIAASARDIARFFYWVFHGRIVPQAQLAEMMDWHYFTTGFMTCPTTVPTPLKPVFCMGYGLGLMQTPITFPAAPGACDKHHPHCLCAGFGAHRQCQVYFTMQGHAGEDWGSSMPAVGFFPDLNVSISLSTNSAAAMNFTGLSAKENIMAPNVVSCELVRVLVPLLAPSFPDFLCEFS